MTDKPNTPEESNEKEKDGLYDVFDDLRGSLAADEEQEEQSSGKKRKGFFKKLKERRLAKRSKKKDADESMSPLEEGDDPAVDEDEDDLEERLAEEYLAEAEALVDEEEDELLEDDDIPLDEDELLEDEDLKESEEPEPEEPVKAPRLSEALETDADHIRDIALEDYTEEELEEVDERKQAWTDYTRGRMGRLEWIVIVVVGLIIGAVFIWGGIQANGGLRLSEPEPTRTPDPNVPIPSSVQLPGGWSFRLSTGSLNTEGQWDPVGAEWLKGTEICKWVALPWSAQLEAVIQTLESGDEIEVTMNNLDVLTYHVYSRKRIDSMQAGELNLDTPSVLIILYGDDSDQKLVLTAVLDYESLE